jgi:hypothetical protein
MLPVKIDEAAYCQYLSGGKQDFSIYQIDTAFA